MIVGKRVTIADSSDPTKKGMRGEVVLETANTVLLQSAEARVTVEKLGTVFLAEGSRQPITGDEIAGRLEDRLRSRKR